jgi:hypothetical protein
MALEPIGVTSSSFTRELLTYFLTHPNGGDSFWPAFTGRSPGGGLQCLRRSHPSDPTGAPGLSAALLFTQMPWELPSTHRVPFLQRRRSSPSLALARRPRGALSSTGSAFCGCRHEFKAKKSRKKSHYFLALVGYAVESLAPPSRRTQHEHHAAHIGLPLWPADDMRFRSL